MLKQSNDLLSLIGQHADTFTSFRSLADVCHEFCPVDMCSRDIPTVVLEHDAALVAGCAGCLSSSYVLPVAGEGVALGDVWLCGEEPQDVGKKRTSFLQIIFIRVQQYDPRLWSRLLSYRSLSNALPGYMARSNGIHTEARIHQHMFERGFRRLDLAAAIYGYFSSQNEKVPFNAALDPRDMSVAIGFDCDDACKVLLPPLHVLDEQRVAEAYADVGQWGCEKGQCNTCDEKDVCDRILDIIAYRQSQAKQQGE